MKQRQTTVEQIAGALRERIMNGDHAPGTPLREEKLARHHQASRNIVREALRILVSEGLVEYSAFKGVRIPALSPDDVSDMYDARRFIECGALRQGAQLLDIQQLAELHGRFAKAVADGEWRLAFELDTQFHIYLASGARSKRVRQWHTELMRQKLAHLVPRDVQAQRLANSVHQHADIVIALAASDPGRACEALGFHLDDAEARLRESLQAEDRTRSGPAVRRPRRVNDNKDN